MSDWRFAQPSDGDETELSRERADGQEAKAILESPIFLKAVKQYRDELAREWLATKQEDVAGRECLYQQSVLLAGVVENLGSLAERGQFAARSIGQIHKNRADRRKEKQRLYLA